MRNSVEGFTFRVRASDAAERARWYESILDLPSGKPYQMPNGTNKTTSIRIEINDQTSLELFDSDDAQNRWKLGSHSFRIFIKVHPEIRLKQLGWLADEIKTTGDGSIIVWLSDFDGNTVQVCYGKERWG